MQVPELHWSMSIGAVGVLASLWFGVLVILTLIRGEATAAQRSARRHTLLVLGPLSLLLVVVALVMYVFVRPIETSSAARDEAIRVFLDAVRRDDSAGLSAVTTDPCEQGLRHR
jgi:hypothetical protein